jgi:hypothetical protein
LRRKVPSTLCTPAYIRRKLLAVVSPRLLKERLMMKSSKSVAAAVAVAVLIAGLCGCEKGPLEKAGRQVDKAFEKAGDKIEDATRKKR